MTLNAGKKCVLKFFLCSLFVCIFFMAASCGLEEYYYLDEPRTDGHIPSYSSTDNQEFYFSFLTTETGDNANYINSASEFKCLGTEVYYKIYATSSSMTSVQSTISSLLSSTSTSSSAAEKLIDTYGYKTLTMRSSSAPSPLVEATGENTYVYIRLNDLPNGDESTSAMVLTGSQKMSSYDASISPNIIGVPTRSLGSDYGFNFTTATSGDYTSSDNPVPVSSDEDIYNKTVSTDGYWYIDMYAITVGRDASYTYSYSKPLLLGSIVVSEEDYD